jgi:hypothetical protein
MSESNDQSAARDRRLLAVVADALARTPVWLIDLLLLVCLSAAFGNLFAVISAHESRVAANYRPESALARRDAGAVPSDGGRAP